MTIDTPACICFNALLSILSFSVLFPSTYFAAFSPFFSVPFSLALYMDPWHLSDFHIYPSIHPSIQHNFIASASFHLIVCHIFFQAFSSCFFIVYFLCFISSLRFFLFLPLYFRAVFRIFSRGFLVLYMAAVTHTTDLEREVGVESGRLDVPHSCLGFYLALALSLPF